MCFGVIRFKFQRPAIARFCLRYAALIIENYPEVVIGISEIRFNLECKAKTCFGFVGRFTNWSVFPRRLCTSAKFGLISNARR